MKVSREELKKILKEGLEDQLGKTSVSTTDRSKDMKKQAVDSKSQKGIDNVERGIIKQINDALQNLAQLGTIKSGNINTILKKLYPIMNKEIQKLSKKQGEQLTEADLSRKDLQDRVEQIMNKLEPDERVVLTQYFKLPEEP